MNLADRIQDDIAEADLTYIRNEAARTRLIVAGLRKLEKDIVTLLKSIDPTEPTRPGDRINRLEKLLAEVRIAITQHFGSVARREETALVDVAEIESYRLRDAVTAAAGVSLLSRGISRARLRKVAASLDADGDVLRGHWQSTATALNSRIRIELRRGIASEESLTGLVRRVRGTGDVRFENGIMRQTERHTATNVATTSTAMLNATREEVYRANSELVEGLQAVNPLDSSTSAICRARAGNAWTLEGDPFSGTSISFPGRPPWHPRCRTFLIPVFREAAALERSSRTPQRTRDQLRRLSGAKKAAIDGRPASGVSFDEWFKRRSQRKQREILGPAKFEIFKKHRLTHRELLDQSGRPLTVQQLREKYPPSPTE